MIFTAYFDESDTHGPAPTVVVAGFLGHAYQWQRFNKRLNEIRERDGFSVLHAKDFKQRRGDFAGWPDEKCRRLVDDMFDLVERRLVGGVAVALERDRYLSEYRAKPFPAKMRVDSQYGVCFSACLQHVARIVADWGNNSMLHVVVEDGHKNVGGAVTIFHAYKAAWQNKSGMPLLGNITIASKKESLELMASDFLAHSYAALYRKQPLGEHDGRPRADPSDNRGLRYVGFVEGALADVKRDFIQHRDTDVANWRARKLARQPR